LNELIIKGELAMRKLKKPVNKADKNPQFKPITGKKITKNGNNLNVIENSNIDEVIHELKVHQIELEMQNDELRRLQLLLENSREKYIDLYDFAPTAYFTLSKDAIIEELNISAGDLLLTERNRLINHRFRKFIFIEDVEIWDIYFLSVLQSEEKKTAEIRLIRPDGSILYTLMNSIRIKSGGDIKGIRMALNDITARKEMENNLRATESELRKLNSEKDRFFSIIAHDLKNPFSGFLFFTELISKDIYGIPKEEVKNILDKLNKSAKNIYQLLVNLLDWASLQQGHMIYSPISINLKNIVEKCIIDVNDIRIKKNISIQIDILPDIYVYSDVQMLETILRNLLTNAVKFTNKQGNINISAVNKPDNITEICVSDSGIGIDEDLMKKLFRINENIKRPGTEDEPSSGLGLLLSRGLIEKNSGALRIESKVGKGSKFYFTLPSKENAK
jgi:PAS domain S-box-containing protein